MLATFSRSVASSSVGDCRRTGAAGGMEVVREMRWESEAARWRSLREAESAVHERVLECT